MASAIISATKRPMNGTAVIVRNSVGLSGLDDCKLPGLFAIVDLSDDCCDSDFIVTLVMLELVNNRCL
jgi:hypothetical protein